MAEFPWGVAHVKSRAEKALARHLGALGIPFYLPLGERQARRGGRRFVSYIPFFPGYVFLRGSAASRACAVRDDLVVRMLDVSDQALLDAELVQLDDLQKAGVPLVPFPWLGPGDPVRIQEGPFRGYLGVIAREKGTQRLIVSVSILRRSVAVELGRHVLAPVPCTHARASARAARSGVGSGQVTLGKGLNVTKPKRRHPVLVGLLGIWLAIGSASLLDADEFSRDRLRAGQEALRARRIPEAVDQIRIACFGLLDEVDALSGCLVYLTLAQEAAKRPSDVQKTLVRFLEVERRFAPYAKATLPADVRREFQAILLAHEPEDTLLAVPSLASLVDTEEQKMARLPAAERIKALEAAEKREPTALKWRIGTDSDPHRAQAVAKGARGHDESSD